MIKKIVILLNIVFCVPLIRAQDTYLMEKGLHIIFPCNKTYFDYKQESWNKLTTDIQFINKYSILTLDSINMYGAASPEGPYNNNVYLSINRTKRVIDSLETRFPGISSIIHSYNIPEDYRRLVYVTKKDSLYQNISSFMRDNDFDTKESLQKDKEMWKYLLDKYYPGLRAVNVVLHIHKDSLEYATILPKLFNIECEIPSITVSHTFKKICTKQPMLRLKSNLIYDALVVPNWSIEFLPKSGYLTPEFKMLWSGFRNDSHYKTWIIHAYELGGRYYFKEGFTKWFTNLAIGLGVYDIQTSINRGYLSKKYLYNNKFEIGCGYVKQIRDSGWTIEYTLCLGCIYSKFNKYHGAESWATPGEFYYNWHLNPKDFIEYNHKRVWIGPVNIGISISYDILYYKKKCAIY